MHQKNTHLVVCDGHTTRDFSYIHAKSIPIFSDQFESGDEFEYRIIFNRIGCYCTFVPPPIVVDDSSLKNVAESFVVALTLTLGGYKSAIAPRIGTTTNFKIFLYIFNY